MELLKDKVIEQLQQVYDPEIPINIYDLGLIYKINIQEKNVDITMSLTSPFCPVAEELPEWVKESVLELDSADTCSVEVTFEPEWGPHMMSEEAQAEMDMWNSQQTMHYDYHDYHYDHEDY